MRLLYLYNEFVNEEGEKAPYRGLSILSLNLSTDRRFTYNRGVLTVENLKRPMPTGFFGDRIYNATTLVGDNGVGKSTILHYAINLLQAIYGGLDGLNGKGLIVVEDKNTTFAVVTGGSASLSAGALPDGVEGLDVNTFRLMLRHIKLIYFSNTLTTSDMALVRTQIKKNDDTFVITKNVKKSFLYNCSKVSQIIEDCKNESGKSVGSAEECLKSFFLYEQYKQVKYVFDKNQMEILERMRGRGIHVPFPRRLYIEMRIPDFSLMCGEEGLCEVEKKYYWGLPVRADEGLAFMFCACCVETYFKTASLFTDEDTIEHARKQIKSAFGVMLPAPPEAFETQGYRVFFEVLGIIRLACLESGSVDSQKRELLETVGYYCESFMGYILDSREKLKRYFTVNPRDDINGGRSVSFSIETTGEPARWFSEFLQKYRYTCEPYYYLDFRWGLSSGEQNLLSLFSSLYYIFGADYTNPNRGEYTIYNGDISGEQVKCDSVMIFIDEADLTYHPEWQRQFLSILTSFLPKIYPESCCRDIQLFLTTHSPLMIGDSPSQSVVYLSKEEDGTVKVDDSGLRQTFGENLYTLLKDSFSVKNGAIGQLARNKIKEALNALKDADELLCVHGGKEERFARDSVQGKAVISCILRLCSIINGTVALLADGIIKSKLELELSTRIDRLERCLLMESDITRISDEELDAKIKELLAERMRRGEKLP